MSYIITPVENGYVLQINYVDLEGQQKQRAQVYQDKESLFAFLSENL